MNQAQREALLTAIRAAGLEHHSEALLGLARPAVRLSTTTEATEGIKSRIGGDPDLPKGTEWPRSRAGTIVPFVCQIELAEIAPVLPESALPAQGLLSFFFLDPFGFDEEVWIEAWGGFGRGPDPFDIGRVIYSPPGVELKRRGPPETPPGLSLTEHRLQARPELTLPPLDSVYVDDLNLSEDEADAYQWKLLPALGEDQLGVHRMLGFQGEVQHDLFAHFGRSLRGRYRRRDMRDWVLLLQLDSDDRIGADWAGMGRVYFGILDTDFTAGRFEKAGADVQHT